MCTRTVGVLLVLILRIVVGVGGFKTGGKGHGSVAMPLLILGTGDVGLSKKCRYLSAD